MPEPKPRQIVSRRSRPAKAPLSLEVIVDTALELLKKEGANGLSMRKVAAHLDTGAASLYVYVKDLDELHRLMLDRAIGAISLSKKGDWRSRLKSLLGGYFRVLYKYPGLAQLALATVSFGHNTMRLLEHILDCMIKGGIRQHDASWAADLLLLYVTAIAAERSLRIQEDEAFKQGAESAMAQLPPSDFPMITAMKDTLLSGGKDRFEWALDVMINGVVETSKSR